MSKMMSRRRGLLPLGLFFFLFLISGLVMTLGNAFGLFGIGVEGYEGGMAFVEILSDGDTWASLGLSFWVALSSSVISIILGTLLAYGLWRYLGTGSKWASALSQLHRIPVVLPHIIVAFLFLLVLGTSGMFSSFFYNLGFGENSRDFFSFIHHSPMGLSMILSYVFNRSALCDSHGFGCPSKNRSAALGHRCDVGGKEEQSLPESHPTLALAGDLRQFFDYLPV
jgi:ABC-type sulfate transport system permease component